MRDLDKLALEAATNEVLLEKFICQHEKFILQNASRVTHRYITKNDDEWSLALMAFNQAVHSYDLNKGGFLKFAGLVIKRRLTDYYRSQTKYGAEIAVNPTLFEAELDEENDDLRLQVNVIEQVSKPEINSSVKLEIEVINQVFASYGFSFFDLTAASPKAAKTKKACAQAVAFILRHPAVYNELKKSKQLPIKVIVNNTNLPRKILERHRKYIIAAIEILSGQFPCLAEYMRFIQKEMD